MEVSWWVVDRCVDTAVEKALARFVPSWIDDVWPFHRPRYIGRDLDWDAWLALPDVGPD